MLKNFSRNFDIIALLSSFSGIGFAKSNAVWITEPFLWSTLLSLSLHFCIFHFHCFQFSEIPWWCALVCHTFLGYSQFGNSCCWFSSGKFTWIILYFLGYIFYDTCNYLKMSFLVTLSLWSFCSLILWYFSLIRVFVFFCLCLFLVWWIQYLSLLRILFFLFLKCFSDLWVVLFPLSSFIFCFGFCILCKSFFFQMFGDSWVSAH